MGEIEIDYGKAAWREKDSCERHYTFEVNGANKTMFVDLTEASSKDINKLLLEDLSDIAGKSKSENLCIALSENDPTIPALVRNLLVFGYEKIGKEETAKYTSCKEAILMKLEVNQEDDFVDLYQATLSQTTANLAM
eukprot:TRINITY_DN157_c0_g3_i1.p3 TRINITY_DN157_c0_g3~~TRINITY_DN157_c0_g3_i1.p3  ORF type:complete len:137 (-),score=30.22 TRINITY_DN157_c0_g3_i1:213-623(-)